MESKKGKKTKIKFHNLFISNLNEKDVDHFTTNTGLYLRKKLDTPYKRIAHKVTGVNIINQTSDTNQTDEEYFTNLDIDKIPLSTYNLDNKKHNIIVERYPKLEPGEPYIFICNHTCPEDIETVLNILDRNAYLVLGSVKTLREELDGYLVWLNGTIPFDISNPKEKKTVIPKASRVLKTNSILIFPEASHNLHPNKLVNNFYDGAVNIALNTNRKIVPISLIRDSKNNVSYVDVSNPIDINKLNNDLDEKFSYNKENLPQYDYNKKKIKTMTGTLRDKMATSIMHILLRHDEGLERKKYNNIESYLRTTKIYDSIEKLHWNEYDDFKGEFKTKKTKEEQDQETIIRDMARLASTGKNIGFNQSNWINLASDQENKNIPRVVKEYTKESKKGKKTKIKFHNLFISNLNEKDVDHFTTNTGLYLRKKLDTPYKRIAHKVTGVNIINQTSDTNQTDEEYFTNLDIDKIPLSTYNLDNKKHNIIVERYPKLEPSEPYIFICNHTCPEDIETVLNILDRNAYLVLGSVKTLREELDGYLVWLNGTIPFDISNPKEKKTVIPKASRVLKTNSILIFPEASHNLHPNKLVNNFYDGAVNIALNTNRKIVPISLIRDSKNNVSYVDVSNPIDINKLNNDLDEKFSYNKENLPQYDYNKKKIKTMTGTLRDKMATSIMHILLRHDEGLERKRYNNIESYLRTTKIYDSIEKLHWNEYDDFKGEFKTKKTKEEQEQETIIRDMARLASTGKNIGFNQSNWINLASDQENKNIPRVVKEYTKEYKKIR